MKGLSLLALALGVATVGAQRPEPPVITALEQYARGEFDAALAVARAIGKKPGYASLDRDLERRGPAWINAVDGPLREQRRFAAAAFALEVARSGLAEWADTRHLVEWGCNVLRDGRPTSFEHEWQLAALGLIQAARDRRFLVGPYPGINDSDRNIRRAVSHLDHVQSRFPEDARFELARVVAREGPTFSDSRHPVWVDAASLSRANLLNRDLRVDASVAQDLIERATTMQRGAPPAADMSRALWELAATFQPLLQAPAIRGEVHMRLGHTYLRLARPDLALPELAQVEKDTADLDVIYLGRYLTGRLHGDHDQVELAASWYRRALEAVPNAQSAALALAALLFIRDERDAAAALVDGAMAATGRDPWREYRALAFRQWSSQIAHLREQFK